MAEEGAKGGRTKLIVIAVAGLLLLAGGGAATAYFMGLFAGGTPTEGADGDAATEDGTGDAQGAEAQAGAGAHADDAPDPSSIVFVDMPDILVNLHSDGKRSRFLKLKVALETASETVAQRIEVLTPRIMDSFQMYLRALTVDEVKGSVGMQRLKEELVARINHAVEPHRVDDMLIKEMLVQ